MDYTENGYNQFLLKEVDVLIANKGLNDSDLGAKEAMTVGEILDKFPDIPVSLVLGDIVANSIAANTITAAMIQAGAVTASKLSVSSLSAISANLGTITAGSLDAVTITGTTITGSTLQTGTTGENVNITSAYISLRNDSTETGYLRGYQSTDRYGSTINTSELSVEYIRARAFQAEYGTVYGNSGGGGTTPGLVLAGNDGFGGSGPIVLMDTVYIGDPTLGSPGLLDVGAAGSDLRIRTSAGAPTGGASGSVALDTTNSRIYFNVGGTWKFAALT